MGEGHKAFVLPRLEKLRALDWSAFETLTQSLVPVLEQVLDGAEADRELDKFLRSHKTLAAPQRALAAELLFGISLWRRRLRARAGQGANALELLQAYRREVLESPEDPPALADRHSLPDWLAETLQREAKDEAGALAHALNTPGPIFLRANRLVLSRQALLDSLARDGITAEPGTLAPDAVKITSARPNLYGTAAWKQAGFEVQDEGSQWLGEQLEAKPGERVLDLCAGAGGKTLQLACALNGEGELHATDVDLKKLERLRVRAGHARVKALFIDGAKPPSGSTFDRVLVDAPCSELGALRRGPDLRWRLNPAGFAQLPVLQRSLLETAYEHLKPGGRLVYATCTFRREENEDVAMAFEAAHPGLARVREPRRLWPHQDGTDGFFAAVWTKPR